MTRHEKLPFYISLAANVFFLGVAAVLIFGLLFSGPRHGPGDKFPPRPGSGFLSRVLPDEARARLEPVLQPKRAAARAAFDEAHAARRAAIETLAAEPYSREVAQAAFAKAREADLAAVSAAQELMTQAMLSLNDDERHAVYKRLSRMLDERDKRRADKKGPAMMDDLGGPGDGPPPPPPVP